MRIIKSNIMKNRKLSAKLSIKELEKVDKMLWAGIWCKLNTWNFPDELNHIKPEWWNNASSGEMQEIIRPLNSHIKSILGERWVSREWNKDRMTEEEHNKWWLKQKLYRTRGH